MSEIKFHPSSNTLSLMTGDRFDSLVESIRKNGLQDPIELLDGLILDGRNRYRACLLAGIEPETVDLDLDEMLPIEYVKIRNLDRRDLSIEERALWAAEAKPRYAAEAKERQKKHGGTAPGKSKNTSGPESGSDSGDSRDQAGAAVGVSGKTVDRAAKIIENGSKALIDAVRAGEIGISTAMNITELPKSDQTAAVKDGDIKEASKKGAAIRKKRTTVPAPPGVKYPEVKAYPVTEDFERIVDQFLELSTRFRQSHGTIDKAIKLKGWDPSYTPQAKNHLTEMIKSLKQILGVMK